MAGMDPAADRAGRAARGEGDAPSRRELVLDLLRSSLQPRTAAALAEQLGVHTNTVRFHLEALLRAGLVQQLAGDPTGPGRPPVLFRATHRMNPDGPTNYRLLAAMLLDHLTAASGDPSATATELGRNWGPHLLGPPSAGRPHPERVNRAEALTRLHGMLDELGFAPEPPAGSRQSTIRLRHCPFLGLATASGVGPGDGDGGVICALHLGLMQGALAALDGPVSIDSLTPFVEPDLCVARLAPAPRPTTARRPTRHRSAARR
jgi:predicted ArsR family transcriptional regulator